MHPIQSQVLKKLALAEVLKFSELKPEAVESNRFVYHLEKLIRERYIEKSEEGYRLAAAGERYVDRLSFHGFFPRLQPKIVTLIILKNEKDEYLFYERKRQPFLGRWGFPYGKIHFGEKIEQAAIRELKEKTGLSARLIHRGDAYITSREKGEVVSYMLAHVFSGSEPKGELALDSLFGFPFWGKASATDKNKFMSGFLEVLKLVRSSKGHFFKEIDA